VSLQTSWNLQDDTHVLLSQHLHQSTLYKVNDVVNRVTVLPRVRMWPNIYLPLVFYCRIHNSHSPRHLPTLTPSNTKKNYLVQFCNVQTPKPKMSNLIWRIFRESPSPKFSKFNPRLKLYKLVDQSFAFRINAICFKKKKTCWSKLSLFVSKLHCTTLVAS
jgi:hypothetical protein